MSFVSSRVLIDMKAENMHMATTPKRTTRYMPNLVTFAELGGGAEEAGVVSSRVSSSSFTL